MSTLLRRAPYAACQNNAGPTEARHPSPALRFGDPNSYPVLHVMSASLPRSVSESSFVAVCGRGTSGRQRVQTRFLRTHLPLGGGDWSEGLVSARTGHDAVAARCWLSFSVRVASRARRASQTHQQSVPDYRPTTYGWSVRAQTSASAWTITSAMRSGTSLGRKRTCPGMVTTRT
jgi:hypothetical protein